MGREDMAAAHGAAVTLSGYGWAWAGTSHISTCMDERAELKMSEQDGVISLHLLWL